MKLLVVFIILDHLFSGMLLPLNAADFIERTGQILQFDGTPFKAGEVRCGNETEKFNPNGTFKIVCPVSGPGLELSMGNNIPPSDDGCINTVKDARYVNFITFVNTSDTRHKLKNSEPIIVKLPKPTSVTVEVVDAQNNPVTEFIISGSVYHFVGLNGIVPKEPGIFPLGVQTPWRCGFMSSRDESRTFSIYPGTSSIRSDTALIATTTVNGKTISKQLDLEFTNFPKLKFCLPFNFGPNKSLPADCSEKISVSTQPLQISPNSALSSPTASMSKSATPNAKPTPTSYAAPTSTQPPTTLSLPDNLREEYISMYLEACKIQRDFHAILNGFDYTKSEKYFEIHRDLYNILSQARDCIKSPAIYGPKGPSQTDFNSLARILKGDGKQIGLRSAWEMASKGIMGFKEKEVLKNKEKTIDCVKGKSSLKVIGKNPKCPAGYKIKK
jgi:hypothetical protein